MVDANQKWGRAQAIEWMKEVNFLRIILFWWIVNGGWLVVDFGLWMFYERGKLLEDQFVLVDCEWWIIGGGFWIVDVL